MLRLLLTTLFFFILPGLFAQDAPDTDTERIINRKGFFIGLYTGGYWANQYSAPLYDGFGFDRDGRRNDFTNSFMNRKINYEFGGGNGQLDQIANALNVNSGDWVFNEGDMPVNMRYNGAIMVGMHMKYNSSWQSAVVVNISASRLNIAGDFTITLKNPLINPQAPGFINYQTFPIKGTEQRLLIQAGFQKIFGDSTRLNFLIEGGPSMALAKYSANQISINGLVIDLTNIFDPINNVVYPTRNMTGIGLGFYAGTGINFSGPRANIQLVYLASFDKINMGEDPRNKLHHGGGLRVYYRMGK